MRLSTFTAIAVVLTSSPAALGSPQDRAVVTCYDRNGDGVADYELHRVAGSVYRSYALIDSKFTGRYDTKMKLAYPFNSDRVDIPVPRRVKVIRGMPPYVTDQRTMPPMPAR